MNQNNKTWIKRDKIIHYLVGQVLKRLPNADPRLVKLMVEEAVAKIEARDES